MKRSEVANEQTTDVPDVARSKLQVAKGGRATRLAAAAMFMSVQLLWTHVAAGQIEGSLRLVVSERVLGWRLDTYEDPINDMKHFAAVHYGSNSDSTITIYCSEAGASSVRIGFKSKLFFDRDFGERYADFRVDRLPTISKLVKIERGTGELTFAEQAAELLHYLGRGARLRARFRYGPNAMADHVLDLETDLAGADRVIPLLKRSCSLQIT